MVAMARWGGELRLLKSVVLCARVKRGAAMLKGKGSQPVCLKQFLVVSLKIEARSLNTITTVADPLIAIASSWYF